MSKHPPAKRAGPASAKVERKFANRPFERLQADLGSRRREPEAARKAATRPPAAPPELDAAPPLDAEIALFRAQVRDVRRVPDANRVILEAPRPAPLPRQPSGEFSSDIDRTQGPRSRQSEFEQAMAGVRPLRGTARVELALPAPKSVVRTAATDIGPLALPAEGSMAPKELLDWALTGVVPIKASNRAEIALPETPPQALQRQEDERSALRESIEAPLTLEDRLEGGDEAVFLRPGLPRRVLTDLRRGRWVLQRELDLHGMTRDQARLALAEFLGACLISGLRCVRLIHGKGLGSPGRIGVLKQLSRGWLAQREEILAFCQAPPHEGGGGALVVLLRAGNAAPRNASAD